MTASMDTPPAMLELLDATPPAPTQIALHVTVEGAHGPRQYWMTEGGILYFRRVNGVLARATAPQAQRIMRGLDLARRSPAFAVRGRTVSIAELDQARGLLAS